MIRVRVLLSRLIGFLNRRRETALDEEIQTHLDLITEEYRHAGLSEHEARAAARRAFGGVIQAQERCRDQRGLPWLDALIRDLRFGVRMLRRTPGFTVIAVIVFAVAIGANTAVYTLIDHVFIRPLPYPEPDRLATVVRHFERGAMSGVGYSQDGATWFALHDQIVGLDIVGSGATGGVNLMVGNHTAYVQQQRVSAGFFRVLGAPPVIGREFTADEDQPGGPAVAVLSHALWVRVFRGDPSVIGQAVTVRGEPHTVVGVMPRGFRSIVPADLWTPLRPSTQGEGRGQNYLLLARLKSGVEWAAASNQVTLHGSAAAQSILRPPPDVRLSMRLVPYQHAVTSEIRQPLFILWAVVATVLLIGCANIAGLMLVRGSARAPELATRIALGGGRVAIVRQILVESVVLAAGGGMVGIAVGYGLSRVIAVRLENVLGLATTPDLRVLFIAAAVSLLTGLLFGLLPAIQASRAEAPALLVASSGRAIASPGRRWPTRFLVTAEVTLGIVLVVAAGLLIRTFSHLTRLPAGIETSDVITGTLSLQDARYQTSTQVNELFTRSLERIRLTPGVEHAAVALTLPYERALNQGWRFSGDTNSQPEPISLTYVTPGYFEVLQIPVRRGRTFTDQDTTAASPIVIVNEAFMRRYGRDGDLLGKRLVLGGAQTPPVEIVGVIGDIQQRVTFGNVGPLSPLPAAYVPASQVDDAGFKLVHTWFQPSWIVRTAGLSSAIVAAMQRSMREIDPLLPFNTFRTIDEVRGEAVTMARIQAALLGAFATIAVGLCVLGVYGLVAFSVAERRREFGVRMALGASAAEVLKAATTPAIVLAASGAAVGLVLAAAVARVMQGLVFGVPVRDPLTFALAPGVVILAAFGAALVPALRLLRVNVTAVLNNRC